MLSGLNNGILLEFVQYGILLQLNFNFKQISNIALPVVLKADRCQTVRVLQYSCPPT